MGERREAMEAIQNMLVGVATTFGVGIGLFVLGRMIPNDKLESWGLNAGRSISKFGGKKLGTKSWEKVENFLQNSISVFWNAIVRGLNEDDAIKQEREDQN